MSADWSTYADFEAAAAPLEWWVHGFIPRGALTLLYGRPGIGKTTFAAWLCAQVQRKGGTAAVVAREDTPRAFAIKAHLSGADVSAILRPNTTAIRLPRDIGALKEAIINMEIDLLYLDSFRGLIEPSAKGSSANEADRSRLAIEPLAEIAAQTGCAIVGTFHPGKSGDYLGSTELEAIARSFLVFERGRNPQVPPRLEDPLRVRQRKSNGMPVDYELQFAIKTAPLIDRMTGEIQQEYARDGSLIQAQFAFASQIEDRMVGSVDETVGRDEEDSRIISVGYAAL